MRGTFSSEDRKSVNFAICTPFNGCPTDDVTGHALLHEHSTVKKNTHK